MTSHWMNWITDERTVSVSSVGTRVRLIRRQVVPGETPLRVTIPIKTRNDVSDVARNLRHSVANHPSSTVSLAG